MGYQFFHEDTFALVRGQAAPTRKGKGPRAAVGEGVQQASNDQGAGAGRGNKTAGSVKRSAREIFEEAIRASADAASHVQAPKPPRVLAGLELDELPAWFDGLVKQAHEVQVPMRDGKMRRQRSDTPIMLGAVASYPTAANEDDPLYRRWRELVTSFARKHYGDRLVSVLEHVDEAFGHIHILVANDGQSVKPIHAGHAAAAQKATEGQSKKLQGEAYHEACRELQDAFHAAVGARVGLARIGPRLQRLTRAEWQATKRNNEAQARAELEAREAIDQAAKKAQQLAVRDADLRAREAALAQRVQKLRAVEQDLDARASKVKTREAEAAKLFEALTPDQQVSAGEKLQKLRQEAKAPAPTPEPRKEAPEPSQSPQRRPGFGRHRP